MVKPKQNNNMYKSVHLKQMKISTLLTKTEKGVGLGLEVHFGYGALHISISFLRWDYFIEIVFNKDKDYE